jgi:hypothetical protein
VSNSYAEHMAEGATAHTNGATHHENPYIWHTVPWAAWNCGWANAEREANPRPNDVDLELEASLVAYGESVQR